MKRTRISKFLNLPFNRFSYCSLPRNCCWPAVLKRIFQDGAGSLKWPPVQQPDYTSIPSIICQHQLAKCRTKKSHLAIWDLMATKSWETKEKRDQAQKKKPVMAPPTTIRLLCRTLLMMVLATRKAILKVISPLIAELKTERSEKGKRTKKVAVSVALNSGVVVDSCLPVEGEIRSEIISF